MKAADVIFGVGGVIFAANLVPTILLQARTKVCSITRFTAFTTAAVLWAYLLADILLRLPLATATGAATATAWTVLSWQAVRYGV